MSEPVHILSLGAGVQSSTLALMAACGEITPMPAAAIFADTKAEPLSVYGWLDWLEKQLPFPVYRVENGDLAKESTRIRTSKKSGQSYLGHSVPAYTKNPDGSLGTMYRICTDKHKLGPLRKKTLQVAGKSDVVLWIGISVDEAIRMKPSNHKRIQHRWPLIDLRMSRHQCLRWMQNKNYPTPPRSACTFCPYHSNREWARLKREDPEAFQSAVNYERLLQASTAKVTRLSGIPFLHPARVPIDTVDFEDKNQPEFLADQFGNECTGLCGV